MQQENKKYDLIIVGGGPAGLSAGIYATRRELKTLIISVDIGGQMSLTNEIENYPGFDSITGFELANKFKKQADKWQANFVFDEVKSIENNKGGFIVKTKKEDYMTKAIILAFGLTPRNLEVSGEEELRGKGVTYCATCDGPLYKNKIVGVVGGGNSALEAAEYLSKLASKVYLIYFSNKFQAEQYLVNRAKKAKNIEFLCCSKIKEIKGKQKLESVVAIDVNDKSVEKELKIDGLFIEIGYRAKTDWLRGLVDLNERGEIIIDGNNKTSVKGIFAAGDCSDIAYKQIVISAGEGAKVALQAYKYIAKSTGKAVRADWGKTKKIK